MDKDTKIELLKIFGMIIILIVLICGIVWLNRAHDISLNETTTAIEKNATKETTSEKSEKKSNKKSDKSSKSSQNKNNSKKTNKKN